MAKKPKKSEKKKLLVIEQVVSYVQAKRPIIIIIDHIHIEQCREQSL